MEVLEAKNDKEKLNKSYKIIEDIQHELYDIDCLLYKAVMKVAYAKGIENITIENKTIDMQTPEQMMIQCRNTASMISQLLNNQITQK